MLVNHRRFFTVYLQLLVLHRGSKNLSSKFGVYKADYKVLNMQIETFNHAESTGDAQEKKTRSYELAFAENN